MELKQFSDNQIYSRKNLDKCIISYQEHGTNYAEIYTWVTKFSRIHFDLVQWKSISQKKMYRKMG